MTEPLLHGRTVDSVFQLLGDKENDLTYSLGWALSQSPQFLKAFVRNTFDIHPKVENVTIRLQELEDKSGITDIEIESPGEFFLLMKANCGWNNSKTMLFARLSV